MASVYSINHESKWSHDIYYKYNINPKPHVKNIDSMWQARQAKAFSAVELSRRPTASIFQITLHIAFVTSQRSNNLTYTWLETILPLCSSAPNNWLFSNSTRLFRGHSGRLMGSEQPTRICINAYPSMKGGYTMWLLWFRGMIDYSCYSWGCERDYIQRKVYMTAGLSAGLIVIEWWIPADEKKIRNNKYPTKAIYRQKEWGIKIS